MRRAIRSAIFSLIILAVGCASESKKEACPSEAEEPVSVCRAREKCRGQNSSVGLGVGLGLGNFGFGVGQSQSTGRYESCLDRDLQEQKQKSSATPAAPSTGSTPSSAPSSI
jgi:hypothetical protein